MGTYSTREFMDLFGGMPDRDEAFPADPDLLLDQAQEDRPGENGSLAGPALAEAPREQEAGA